jgi:hypothetical protein
MCANVASNEQNQCFTVAVGAQLTISNCLTRHKVYEMQSVDEMNPTAVLAQPTESAQKLKIMQISSSIEPKLK